MLVVSLAALLAIGCTSEKETFNIEIMSEIQKKQLPATTDSGEASGEPNASNCHEPPRLEITSEVAEGYDSDEAVLIPVEIGTRVPGPPKITFSISRSQSNLETGDDVRVISTVKMYGFPVDTGQRELAVGTVTDDTLGIPATYTLATGDASLAIAERFCVYPDYLTLLNVDNPRVHPGDLMLLQPSS